MTLGIIYRSKFSVGRSFFRNAGCFLKFENTNNAINRGIMKASGILKLTGILSLVLITGSMVTGCKNSKADAQPSSVNVTVEVQKEQAEDRHSVETKAELVGNY